MRCDYKMLRYMAKVRLQDRVSYEEVWRRCGVEDLEDRLRRARLRWFGHVRRREEGHILRRAVELEVEWERDSWEGLGRPGGREWRRTLEI